MQKKTNYIIDGRLEGDLTTLLHGATVRAQEPVVPTEEFLASLAEDDRAAFESLSSMLSEGRFADLIDFIPTWGKDTSDFRNVDPQAFALGTDGAGNYWLLCRDGSVQCWGHDEGGHMEDHNSFSSLAEAMECFVVVTAVREKHLSLDEARPRFADREEGGWTWHSELLEEWAEDEG